eukprot:SAG11_NODE_257_length_11556_cov_8.547176_2_plen_65_part_00
MRMRLLLRLLLLRLLLLRLLLLLLRLLRRVHGFYFYRARARFMAGTRLYFFNYYSVLDDLVPRA